MASGGKMGKDGERGKATDTTGKGDRWQGKAKGKQENMEKGEKRGKDDGEIGEDGNRQCGKGTRRGKGKRWGKGKRGGKGDTTGKWER